MTETIRYIISFLLNVDITDSLVETVGYTNLETEFSKFRVIIKPSNFFDADIYGTESSLPTIPLTIWEETPVLFGEDESEKIGDTIILHADLIASTYFLISRYEEWVRKNVRDAHGRFPGKESLPYKAGFIDRPLVEEYGKLLRDQLRLTGLDLTEPPQQIKKIYLTHDVDNMAHYRNFRGLVGGLLRGIKKPKEGEKALKTYLGDLRSDPWYTFPFLFKLDNEIVEKTGANRCEIITFFRSSTSKKKEDKPVPNLIHPDHKTLFRYCKKKNIKIGLHVSYLAGMQPYLIHVEKERLENAASLQCIMYSRYHYLATREPMDMFELIKCKITDDFSLGYADMAGFRLGTCRPVKWINLITKEISELTLHPLAIMDISLSDKRYMYMNAHDAYEYCTQLINTVEKYNGELCILWHNTTVEKRPDSYHRKLYRDLIKYLHDK